MYKKTITYTDFNDEQRTEDFYFNLTKAEIMEMELGQAGGLEEYVRKIINTMDGAKIVALFKDLILKAYGEKSLDGRRFMKNEEITKSFSETEAYSELFMELAMDAEKAAEFVNGITPKDTKKVTVDDAMKTFPGKAPVHNLRYNGDSGAFNVVNGGKDDEKEVDNNT